VARDWTCTGDVSLTGSEITVGTGGGSCTITNDDMAPGLTLLKQVVNDNGGTLAPADWTLTATGPTPISGAGGATSGAGFSAGTYVLSETGPATYSASAWACVGTGVQTGDAITLGPGESATCTITNDDIQPVLTLVKQVTNDNGGLLTVGDFPLFVNSTPVVSGVPNGFNTGTYSVSEAIQAGYEAGTWSGDCAADGTVQLSIGDSKTCTLVNDDIPPELKIVKTALGNLTVPGGDMAYSITVSNIGGGDALGVTLTDALPPAGNLEENLAPLPWATSTPGCTVSEDGASLTCDIGTLEKDPTPDQVESGDEASFTVDLTATIPLDYLTSSPDNPGGSGTLGSNFEIDGNLLDEDGTAGLDWGSPGLALINVLDPPLTDLSPDYSEDNAFTDGAKENDPVPVVLDHSVPPNKSDLTNFLIAQDEVDGNGFLALGWIRTDSLGTANFDFELNQLDTLTANGVTPVRTTGDVLISFDFESSGNVVTLSLREWEGDRERWSQPRTLNIEGTGFAAINDPLRFGTQPGAEINPFTGLPMPDQSFGEALINLTQTFGDDCRKFVSAFVKGRSSTPFTAVLKDFVSPYPALIDTCRHIDMLNVATADATNPGQDPVSDTATVLLSNDPIYTADPDEDGIPNYLDPDDDNDGVADEADAFPFDPSEWADSDGDGVGDNADAFPNDPTETTDTDGDGVGDNGDAFPNDPTETADSDGDGVGDNADAFPNDPTETVDSDGDGIGNNADPDDDNDGLSDAEEQARGTDPFNPDTDGDGVGDASDAFPLDPSESVDTDGDGVGDNGDAFPNDPTETADSDGDGVGDNADAFPNDPTETTDSDGDGVGDNGDAFPLDPSEWADSDGDGVGNNADAFPNDPTETTDSDGDGVGDNGDAFPNDPTETTDSDGDGVGDNADAFPNDPTETTDSDGDGVGDNADAFPNDPAETVDSDGDGVGDNGDAFPNDPSESADSDGDGVGDNADAFPNDPAETVDSDGDGVGDNGDALPNDPTETVDTDGDGIGNNADADDDNDGLTDAFEVANGFDPLTPGEGTADPDGDGLDNLGEQAAGTDPFDPDGDGDGRSDGDEVASGSNPNMAPTPIDWAAVSPDATVELGGVMVEPGDVAVENLLGLVVPMSLGTLPTGVNVTAYHLFQSGDQLFSLDGAAMLGGSLPVGPEDVVRYDGDTYTMEFDGSAEGVPGGAGVDAVSLDGEDLLLSFDSSVTLESDTFDEEDLVRFDGIAFTLFFDGSAAGVPEGLDLDAAHHLGDDHVALSFDGSGTLPPVVFADEDVLEYDASADAWEICYDGSAEHATWADLRLRAAIPALERVLSSGQLSGRGSPPDGGLPAACGMSRRRRALLALRQRSPGLEGANHEGAAELAGLLGCLDVGRPVLRAAELGDPGLGLGLALVAHRDQMGEIGDPGGVHLREMHLRGALLARGRRQQGVERLREGHRIADVEDVQPPHHVGIALWTPALQRVHARGGDRVAQRREGTEERIPGRVGLHLLEPRLTLGHRVEDADVAVGRGVRPVEHGLHERDGAIELLAERGHQLVGGRHHLGDVLGLGGKAADLPVLPGASCMGEQQQAAREKSETSHGGSLRPETSGRGIPAGSTGAPMLAQPAASWEIALRDLPRPAVRAWRREDPPVPAREEPEGAGPGQATREQQGLLGVPGDEGRSDPGCGGSVHEHVAPDHSRGQLERASRVAEPDSRHHGQDGGPHGSRGEGMKTCRDGNRCPEVACSSEQETRDHPGRARMERPQQRIGAGVPGLGAGVPGLPAGQPSRCCESGERGEETRQRRPSHHQGRQGQSRGRSDRQRVQPRPGADALL
jgi:uncharacterized repeat protein (TIGR01451 family)